MRKSEIHFFASNPALFSTIDHFSCFWLLPSKSIVISWRPWRSRTTWKSPRLTAGARRRGSRPNYRAGISKMLTISVPFWVNRRICPFPRFILLQKRADGLVWGKSRGIEAIRWYAKCLAGQVLSHPDFSSRGAQAIGRRALLRRNDIGGRRDVRPVYGKIARWLTGDAHRTSRLPPRAGGAAVPPHRHHFRGLWREGRGRTADPLRHHSARHRCAGMDAAGGRPRAARQGAEPFLTDVYGAQEIIKARHRSRRTWSFRIRCSGRR